MKICTLSSGSKGNCTYIESGPSAVLIDQGLSLRELERRALGVGLDLKKVQMVAVTHEHTDHIAGLATLTKRCPIPVYARGVQANGPLKNGLGEIGVPVPIGGIVIYPGDIIAGGILGLTVGTGMFIAVKWAYFKIAEYKKMTPEITDFRNSIESGIITLTIVTTILCLLFYYFSQAVPLPYTV